MPMSPRARLAGWAAAGLTFVWFVVHTFVGGAEVAAPLRAADLPIAVMAPAWMVWHMVTLILLLNAALFALGTHRGDRSFLLAGAAIAAAFCLSGIAAAILTGAGFAQLPQGLLFVPTAALGAWAARSMAQ